MTFPASHRDLLEGPVAVLATNGPDGRPQVTALWFLLDDEDRLRLSLNTARQKTKNLLADPEATLFFVDPANPYRTLEVRGTVDIEPDSEYVLADQVGAKYDTDFRKLDAPGTSRVAITFHPVRVNTFG